MKTDLTNYIEALKELQLYQITDHPTLQNWQGRINSIVNRIYGNQSDFVDRIKSVKFKNYPRYGAGVGRNVSSWGGGDNASFCDKTAKSITASIIADLETLGIPEKEIIEKGGDVNITLSQTQTLNSLQQIVISSLQQELTGKQLESLQKVLESNEKDISKNEKILTKIGSFSKDVISNILANILTGM